MTPDEQAIRDVIETWQRANRPEDLAVVLNLMTEDVVFLRPGQPPMRGRDAFEAAAKGGGASGMRIESSSEVQELRVVGDWAYCWNQLKVTMIPADGDPVHRSGPVLSIFRRDADGQWRLARDANMLTVEAPL